MDLTDELLHVPGRECKDWLLLQVRKHHPELFHGVRTLSGSAAAAGRHEVDILAELVGFRSQYGHEADHDYVLQLWLWI